MKKPQFKTKINHYISYVVPILSILPVTVLCLASSHFTSALTYQDNIDIDFTLNPTINLTLSSNNLIIDNLAPGSASDSNIITATVSTNAGWGYYLSVTANTSTTNTNLTHETSESGVFANLSSNKASLSDFSDNTWGYSYSTDGGTNWISGDTGNAIAGYNGLPLDNNDSGSTGIKLLNPNSYASSGSIQFKIGAKAANTQAAGTYTGTINFYAVTNPQALPYMQDMNSTTLNYLMPNINDTTILVDKRDEQTYRVAKLKDGKYWMVENLNLAGGTAISCDTTDCDNYTIPEDQGWQAGGRLPESSISGFKEANYTYVYNSNENNCGTSEPCYSYYSWDAVTLGSGRIITSMNADAPYSICPKGWHLPNTRTGVDSVSDFRALLISYGGSDLISEYTVSTEPTGALLYSEIGSNTIPNFHFTGYYYDGSFRYGDSNGRYWSATSGSTNSDYNARDLVVSISNVNTTSNLGRNFGFAVRCLFSGQ